MKKFIYSFFKKQEICLCVRCQNIFKDSIIYEANGISKGIFSLATNSLSIPRFNTTNKPESLNVATATAILLSEFNR